MLNHELTKKAESGHLDAILTLADAYYNGNDGDQNKEKAYGLYLKVLSEQPENAYVINKIGNCYKNGYGVKQDDSMAFDYYKRAAEMGYINAQYNYADSLRAVGDTNCVEWYEKAFLSGDADAPYALANIYKEGKLVAEDETKALEYLRRASDIGNTSATIDLACTYLEGKIVKTDTALGLTLMKKAADAGNAVAASKLSSIYEKGEGVEAEIEASIEWAIRAAELGEPSQIFNFAVALFNGNQGLPEDEKRALEYFILAAGAGSITAMENAGVCYNNGYGTGVNKKEAIVWFEKAARYGTEKSLHNLETLYVEVYGDTGHQKYIDLLKNIAEDGYPIAMFRLHNCYHDGKHTEKDIDCAARYLDDAVEKEDSDACFFKGCYLFYGNDYLPQNEEAAVPLWKVVANKGNAIAAFNVGLCYRNGRGVSVDIIEAVKWFEQAADKNHVEAILILADIYLKGADEISANPKVGISYLERAVDLGNTDAMSNLGACYYNGKYGLVKNIKKAMEYWKSGSEAGNSDCTKNIALCYKNGEGIPQNPALAIQYFEKAVSQGNITAMIELGLAYDDNGLTTVDYEKAVKYYTQAYKAGSGQGAYCLATMYENGHGVETNPAKVFELYKFSVEKNFPHGMVALGILYHDGVGTEKDIAKAVECFERGKALGDERADELLAFLYSQQNVDGINPEKVFAFNLKRAEEGNVEAQYQVCVAYATGKGVEENTKLSYAWCQKAADNGLPAAQRMMGFESIMMGNTSLAIEYWEKAGEGGDLDAVCDLAEFYLDGNDGIPENKVRAIELYKKAASKNFPRAELYLGICYMLGNGVAEDQYEAVSWFEKAALQGNADAQKNMGLCLKHGDGIATDKQKAAEWFEKAVEQDHVHAKVCLATMLSEGDGIPVNYSRAEDLYREVLDIHDEESYDKALFGLAIMYKKRTEDRDKAFPLWKESAERGNATSQFNLGLCYQKGWGTSVDLDQAIYWWSKAAAQGESSAQHNVEVAMLQKVQENSKSTPENTSSGGCYVASAVYGSYDCPEVWTLRRFRDHSLKASWYGRVFIKAYYAISPTLVNWFGDTKWFKCFWKSRLDQMVKTLQDAGYESTPYNDRDH